MHYRIERPRRRPQRDPGCRDGVTSENREMQFDLARLGKACCEPQTFVSLVGAPLPAALEAELSGQVYNEVLAGRGLDVRQRQAQSFHQRGYGVSARALRVKDGRLWCIILRRGLMTTAEMEDLFARTLLGDHEGHDAWEAVNALQRDGSRGSLTTPPVGCGQKTP